MSKHEVLTAEELADYRVNPYLVELVDQYRMKNRLAKAEIRILDFGSGRGRSILKLRMDGFDAYGVDVDVNAVTNGYAMFKQVGFDPVKYNFTIKEDCKTHFPDKFFDIVFSQQVVEHVRDIEAFFEEIARVTKPGGVTYHSFPFKYHVTEQHLFMPIIHWLPKNVLRRIAILFWVRMGREPHWKGLEGSTSMQKSRQYYSYSIHKTYYRTNGFFNRFLSNLGFAVTLRKQKQRFRLRNPNTYFAHTTELIGLKSFN